MNNIVVLINFRPVNYSALIIDVEYSDEFEISYFIKSDYRRKGIVYNAIKLLIEVFFDNKVTRMRVNKDHTKHKIENLEANKLVEKTINVCKFTIVCKEDNITSNILDQKLCFTYSFTKDGENSYYLINPKFKKTIK